MGTFNLCSFKSLWICMTKDEIIKALRDMAKYPTVTLPRDCEALRMAADLLAQPEQEPWECVCGANLYIDANGVPRSKASVEPATVMFKPDQEPVAWMYEFYADMGHKGLAFEEQRSAYNTPLYTTPPQRKPLTDEEIILIVAECAASHQHTDIHFARAIERAHGIKGEA